MATISLQCNRTFKHLLQAEISMTDRAYMGEVPTQEMSELFDKEVNAQKESLKKLPGFTQVHEKVCDENETKKNNMRIKCC